MIEKHIVFNLFNTHLTDAICHTLGYELGNYDIHTFPDEEIRVTVHTPVNNRKVILMANLDKPNTKMATLMFLSDTLRTLGTSEIGIIAPYLPYMRQDKQFHPGEGITSQYFATFISRYCNWIITIDPHLHRWHRLDDIFTIHTQSLHATRLIADWVKKNIKNPVLIGPDQESAQWIAEVAKDCEAPYLIVEKNRIGDTNVSVSLPTLDRYLNRVPVVIDDIISTGITMIETIKQIQSYQINLIHCIAIHALFAKDAYHELLKTGVKDIVTCNTVSHITNQIDISSLIVNALKARSLAQ
ncbi:MAG: ribose-phosphate diphosphokinase [Gammaproteobacteria bacterium]|nr:ribose-phosphate diphosphokinase [Gammaproteobacteria bacterium]